MQSGASAMDQVRIKELALGGKEPTEISFQLDIDLWVVENFIRWFQEKGELPAEVSAKASPPTKSEAAAEFEAVD